MATPHRLRHHPRVEWHVTRSLIERPNVIYEMGGVSADGYIVGPDGKFDWAVPDEELHRFHNQQARALAGHLLGRRLYETMVYWETADKDPSDIVREFALIWQALPKVVFSRTLGQWCDVWSATRPVTLRSCAVRRRARARSPRDGGRRTSSAPARRR